MMVFKKSVGHSSKDVHVLRRLDDKGTFECFLTRNKVTILDLQEWADSYECIIEQSLSTFQEIIPIDFKCYLIDGKVRYIGLFNRNSTKTFLTYFHGESFEQIKFDKIFSTVPQIWFEGFSPFSPELIHRMSLAKAEAERIAGEILNVRGIIISLDMYVVPLENGFKVWLGEITPRPGAIHSNWLRRDFIRDMFGLTNTV